MNKILEKRNSLERFIQEQTIGPGINGYRYVNLEEEVLLSKQLSFERPLDYHAEILNIAPAAVYSTGILFPDDSSGTIEIGNALDNNETSDPDEEDTASESQSNSGDDIETDDNIELNQMFPRTMGFTCCLSEQCLTEKTIEFKINIRYYKKIHQDKEGKFNNKYGILLEADVQETQKFLSEHKLNSFTLKIIKENAFLTIARMNSLEITGLKTRIRAIQKKIAEILFDKTATIISLKELTKTKCFLSSLKSHVYYELKNHEANEIKRKQLYDISQEIELVENITDHLRNLLDVISNGYGLWQSEPIEAIVKISNLDFLKPNKKKTFLYKKRDYTEDIIVINSDGSTKEGLSDIFKFTLDDDGKDFASLSANILISRDARKEQGRVFVKIQVVNTSTPFKKEQEDSRYYSTFNELVNQKSFFGVKLSLSSDHLIPYSDFAYVKKGNSFDEDTTTRFIYDQFKDYGIGHGCSVKWDALTKRIETEYLPSCETPDVDPVPRNKTGTPSFDPGAKGYVDALFLESGRAQEFKWLSKFSDADDTLVIEELIEFVDSYGRWITIKRSSEKYQSQYAEIAGQELDKCEADYLRMRNNILNFLSGDINRQNLESFRLMNSVMFMQLWHSVKIKRKEVAAFIENTGFSTFDFRFYKEQASDFLFKSDSPASWRAFQLAFILLNIDGIFKMDGDLVWDKRNNWVDLVWFPTGGGKTEAYLGLIALTVINRRRLHGEAGGGSAAIMRYTLRLLTMQQFQRATLVIMALELIRRWGMYNLGAEPITIGLWVGKDSLPNSNKDLVTEYESKLNVKRENRIPFEHCPWCGTEIKGETKEDIDTTTDAYNKNRVHLKCINQKCSFSFGIGRISKKREDQGPIPVCLSDETIYQHPPTLLFGTVDKFAQLAHKVDGTADGINADSRRIFGKGRWEAGKPARGYLPPDLIIQDELHLLLGPLGSAVALFESAVNQLCTREDGTRPKIISSTATTRNTQLQIAALFDRNVNLFPKPGVECDDSFFAFYKRRYENQNKETEVYLSNRKYIGILPTGRTQIWMQMRLAAIIMTHRAIFELKELGNQSPIDFIQYDKFEKAVDYYHTTISYFNSLKEVGKTQSQVQTYLLKELRRVFSRVVRPQKLMHSIYTYGPIKESELTGRLSGEEVKNELKRVESKWIAKDRFAQVHENEIVKGHVPSEFVVATNMISVGIDVSRFNTIIINSMPRNTAEYIQATSRVARESYGLVLTVHHPFRARDVSHYEKFIEFHEKMYSYVEPISITPFTKKAVERYMGLYLATMIRHRIARFTNRKSAGAISTLTNAELLELITEVTGYFVQRQHRMEQFETAISNLLKPENINQIREWIAEAMAEWKTLNEGLSTNDLLVFTNKRNTAEQSRSQEQLYVDIEEYEGNIHSKKWQVPMSLRVIEPEASIKIYPQ